jgi:hypothetical protein
MSGRRRCTLSAQAHGDGVSESQRESEGVHTLGNGNRDERRRTAVLLLTQAGEGDRRVVPIAYGNRPSWLVRDPNRMKTAFGWEPAVSLMQGSRIS